MRFRLFTRQQWYYLFAFIRRVNDTEWVCTGVWMCIAPRSPQTSRHSAPRVYRWAQRWARLACRCSRSRTGMSRRLLGPGCPSLAGGRRGQRGRVPFLQLGSDPPPVCVWLPLRSRHSYKEGGRKGQIHMWSCQCMAEAWRITSDLRITAESASYIFLSMSQKRILSPLRLIYAISLSKLLAASGVTGPESCEWIGGMKTEEALTVSQCLAKL